MDSYESLINDVKQDWNAEAPSGGLVYTLEEKYKVNILQAVDTEGVCSSCSFNTCVAVLHEVATHDNQNSLMESIYIRTEICGLSIIFYSLHKFFTALL